MPFLLCGLEGNAAFTSVLSLLNTHDTKTDSCAPSLSFSSGPVRGILYLVALYLGYFSAAKVNRLIQSDSRTFIFSS